MVRVRVRANPRYLKLLDSSGRKIALFNSAAKELSRNLVSSWAVEVDVQKVPPLTALLV